MRSSANSTPLLSQVKLQRAEAAAASWGEGGAGHGPGPSMDHVQGGNSSWRAFDSAVSQLLTADEAAAQQQKRFFGRLCNALIVLDRSMLQAVNSVLSEVCHLPTAVVVSDRATAYEVVALFKSQRVGKVTCRVLSEMSRQQAPAPEISLPGGISGQAVAAAVGLGARLHGVAGAEGLVGSLLAGWAVVRDRDAAQSVMQAQRQQHRAPARGMWSLVTLSGEVFKADGEIVARLGSNVSAAHCSGPYDLDLTVKPTPPHSDATAAVRSSDAETPGVSAGEAAQKLLSGLRAEVDSLVQRVAGAEAELLRAVRRQRQLLSQAAEEARMAEAARSKAAALSRSLSEAGPAGDAAPPSAQGGGSLYMEELRTRLAHILGQAAASDAAVEASMARCLAQRRELEAASSSAVGCRASDAAKRLKEASRDVSKV